MSQRAVTAATFGAWLVKADPQKWDIGRWLRGEVEITAWSVRDTYRLGLVRPGQPVVLWISGKARAHPAGAYALGRVLGPPETGQPDADWLDLEAAASHDLFLPMSLGLLSEPVLRQEFLEHGALRDSEVIRQPKASNPSFLTKTEYAALLDLAGEEMDITLGPHGAGFGSAEHNRRVEVAAVGVVRTALESDGWSVRSVEREYVGYDLECTRGVDVKHVEVKGVSGSRPQVLLTANEYNVAGQDPAWELHVVTDALGHPTVSVHRPDTVRRSALPLVYRVNLG